MSGLGSPRRRSSLTSATDIFQNQQAGPGALSQYELQARSREQQCPPREVLTPGSYVAPGRRIGEGPIGADAAYSKRSPRMEQYLGPEVNPVRRMSGSGQHILGSRVLAERYGERHPYSPPFWEKPSSTAWSPKAQQEAFAMQRGGIPVSIPTQAIPQVPTGLSQYVNAAFPISWAR